MSSYLLTSIAYQYWKGFDIFYSIPLRAHSPHSMCTNVPDDATNTHFPHHSRHRALQPRLARRHERQPVSRRRVRRARPRRHAATWRRRDGRGAQMVHGAPRPMAAGNLGELPIGELARSVRLARVLTHDLSLSRGVGLPWAECRGEDSMRISSSMRCGGDSTFMTWRNALVFLIKSESGRGFRR